jgi:hypothetical protein
MTPPILFLVFNRPDTTARVFEAIRAARPARLYVAADGPRAGRVGEVERCAEARRIATSVDWPCQVRTLFRGVNLGCRLAVGRAITWFFEQEPEGIVLEDDTLPDQTFFLYCAELLERYREDSRVMAICGGEYFEPGPKPSTSYCFCRTFDPWGWATWRRAWAAYDSEMESLDEIVSTRAMTGLGPRRIEYRSYWESLFKAAREGTIDTWDYQWIYTIFKERGFVAFPAQNLVSNLGFIAEATHTVASTGEAKPSLAERPIDPMLFPMKHPAHVAEAYQFEEALYAFRFGVVRRSMLWKLKAYLKRELSKRLSEAAKRRIRHALAIMRHA